MVCGESTPANVTCRYGTGFYAEVPYINVDVFGVVTMCWLLIFCSQACLTIYEKYSQAAPAVDDNGSSLGRASSYLAKMLSDSDQERVELSELELKQDKEAHTKQYDDDTGGVKELVGNLSGEGGIFSGGLLGV